MASEEAESSTSGGNPTGNGHTMARISTEHVAIITISFANVHHHTSPMHG
jgi:hypothetical protein